MTPRPSILLATAALGLVLVTAGCAAAPTVPPVTPAAQEAPVTQMPAQRPAAAPATPSAQAQPAQAQSAQDRQGKPTRPTPGAAAGLDAAADGLRPFLLTPAEIGAGFVAGEEPKPDPATPALCGGPGVVAQFPYAVRVGATADRGPGRVQETVSVYGDEGTATAAYRASVAGMDCSQGRVGDAPAVIAPAEDLLADLPYAQATGWRVGGAGFDVVMIAVRDGEVVVNITVLAPEDGLPGLPDPLVVAQAAAQKLLG